MSAVLQLGEVGASILSSQLGLTALHQEVSPLLPAGSILPEATSTLDLLLPHLREGGVATTELEGAVAFAKNSGDPLDNSLALLKLTAALENLAGADSYRAAADACAFAHNIVSKNPGPSRGHALFRAIAGREAALADRQASGRSYAQRFRELGKIAGGGQADIVALAELGEDGNPTDRKFIAWKPREARSMLGTFYAYAKAALRLDHPNIVGLREVVVENGTMALILDVAPGLSLDKHLAAGNRFSAGQIQSIKYQVLEALQYAWGEGFIHRDLKPSNVMVAVNPESGAVHVTLLDFGVAKDAAIKTGKSSAWKGTWNYWAPEQIEAGLITNATDIHGLGLVLLDLLRGREREEWILKQKPAEEIEALRKKFAADSSAVAYDAILDAIEIMTATEPEKRLAILGGGELAVRENETAMGTVISPDHVFAALLSSLGLGMFFIEAYAISGTFLALGGYYVSSPFSKKHYDIDWEEKHSSDFILAGINAVGALAAIWGQWGWNPRFQSRTLALSAIAFCIQSIWRHRLRKKEEARKLAAGDPEAIRKRELEEAVRRSKKASASWNERIDNMRSAVEEGLVRTPVEFLRLLNAGRKLSRFGNQEIDRTHYNQIGLWIHNNLDLFFFILKPRPSLRDIRKLMEATPRLKTLLQIMERAVFQDHVKSAADFLALVKPVDSFFCDAARQDYYASLREFMEKYQDFFAAISPAPHQQSKFRSLHEECLKRDRA